jgi:predicted RNase H-like HicB family nuclease
MENKMIDISYSLVIEATKDPEFFSFYSPDLEGFTGVGHSLEDCLYKARWGMRDFVRTLQEMNLPVPPPSSHPTITIQNENEREVA